METFHILHLAKSWSTLDPDAAEPITSESSNPLDSPVSDLPTAYTLTEKQPSATHTAGPRTRPSKMHAASVQMIFAARQSRDFITPEVVLKTEAWTSEAVLEALVHFEILPEVRLEFLAEIYFMTDGFCREPTRAKAACGRFDSVPYHFIICMTLRLVYYGLTKIGARIMKLPALLFVDGQFLLGI